MYRTKLLLIEAVNWKSIILIVWSYSTMPTENCLWNTVETVEIETLAEYAIIWISTWNMSLHQTSEKGIELRFSMHCTCIHHVQPSLNWFNRLTIYKVQSTNHNLQSNHEYLLLFQPMVGRSDRTRRFDINCSYCFSAYCRIIEHMNRIYFLNSLKPQRSAKKICLLNQG